MYRIQVSVFTVYVVLIMINAITLIPFVYSLTNMRSFVDSIEISAIGSSQILHYKYFRLYQQQYLLSFLILIMPGVSIFLLTDWSREYYLIMSQIFRARAIVGIRFFPLHNLANSLVALLIYIMFFNSEYHDKLSCIKAIGLYLFLIPPLMMLLFVITINLYRNIMSILITIHRHYWPITLSVIFSLALYMIDVPMDVKGGIVICGIGSYLYIQCVDQF